MKIFENIAQTLKENGLKRSELFQQMMEPAKKEQTELELFFCSMCKTVEKFSPFEQAKMKMQISHMVSQVELAQLGNSQRFHPMQPQNVSSSVNENSYSGQGIPGVPPIRTEFGTQLQNTDGTSANPHYNTYQYQQTNIDNSNGQTYTAL